MTKDRVEKRLEELKARQAAGVSEEGINELRKALGDKVNVVVAKAAALADEWRAAELAPDLLRAFSRLLAAPNTDPQCWGKNAISKALKELGWAESDVFLRGLAHRQFEPTWGGKTDTAGVLRGTCALALVQCTDLPRHEVLSRLVEAMTEAEARVRADAARALEQMSGNDASLLLRLKARCGDEEVRVTGQVLESILQLEGARAVSFAGEFLGRADQDLREEAALALGASRLPEAVQVLIEACGEAGPDEMVFLRAISASRQDAALEFLLEQVRGARFHTAEAALCALELHRESEEIVRRIREAIGGRDELRELFELKFPLR